uniref:DEP domain-containing protein n=1 Tax=Ganoderma boninense TaxID=34458 RepID=A0A5K1K6N1_9APHY|nr:DEP domain-containing protein [Ganoderma boninense]
MHPSLLTSDQLPHTHVVSACPQTAKAELAKVRQQRPFELETVNIQDPGQERWKRKYVYWIPALHLEGKEVAKGRWDAQTVHQALDSKEYVHQWLYGTPLYDRVHEEDVLGEEVAREEEDAHGNFTHRCFNCGEPGHIVGECTEPLDRRLVALSRQYFEFFRKDPGLPRLRVHEVEEWRRQRLEWLDAFDPGQIRGSLLRDALGLREGDAGEGVEWLPNIANWGYPPGWVGPRDPREQVWQRIADASPPEDDDADDEELLYIFAEGDPEVCELSGHAVVDSDSRSETLSVADEEHCLRVSFAEPPSRWATYPDTYFLWSRLPVCTGWVLPAIGADEPPPSALVSRTHTDHATLWQSITSLPHQSRGVSVPPWRALSSLPPPPPTTTPPPPSCPPPPLPSLSLHLPEVDGHSLPSRSLFSMLHGKANESDVDVEGGSDTDDMDLSD